MKSWIKRVARGMGIEIQRVAQAPAASADRIAQVCEALKVPRMDAPERAAFAAVCPPLFPQPTPVPRDYPWKAHADAEAAVFNQSMPGYFECARTPAGPTITDAHAASHHWSRQRRIYAVVRKHFGDSFGKASVLDIGCSSGYYCFHADRMGAASVLGIDARPEHEEQFALLHGMLKARPTCRYQHVDMEFGLEQITESYDLVLAQGVMYHVFDHPRFLKNLHRLTRRVLILETACSGRTDEYCRAMLEDPKHLRESIHGPVLYPSLSWAIQLARWTGFRSVTYVNYPADLPPSEHHQTLWRAMLMCEK